MEIFELEGEDKRLYELVAHLVMNVDVLNYNLNYPFRTSSEYKWYVAVANGRTLGFIPVRIADGKAVINNYYVAEDDGAVFAALLGRIVSALVREFELESVSQTRHIRFFEESGFAVVLYWKRYVKMRAYRDEKERV